MSDIVKFVDSNNSHSQSIRSHGCLQTPTGQADEEKVKKAAEPLVDRRFILLGMSMLTKI